MLETVWLRRHSFLTCFSFMVSGFDLDFFYAVRRHACLHQSRVI